MQFHIKRCSDERWYIVFTFDLFLPSPSAPRATLQTLFILSWAVVSCFLFSCELEHQVFNFKFRFLAAKKQHTTSLEMKWFRVCAAVALASVTGRELSIFHLSASPHSSAAADAIEIVSWKRVFFLLLLPPKRQQRKFLISEGRLGLLAAVASPRRFLAGLPECVKSSQANSRLRSGPPKT